MAVGFSSGVAVLKLYSTFMLFFIPSFLRKRSRSKKPEKRRRLSRQQILKSQVKVKEMMMISGKELYFI